MKWSPKAFAFPEAVAKEKTKALKSILPQVKLIKKEKHFFVVLGGPKPKSRALLEAAPLKRAGKGLGPSLIKSPLSLNGLARNGRGKARA